MDFTGNTTIAEVGDFHNITTSSQNLNTDVLGIFPSTKVREGNHEFLNKKASD